jgi:hypothetical protein
LHELTLNLVRALKRYLLDGNQELTASLKDKTVLTDWALLRNQVFLGVLGSLVVPRCVCREFTSVSCGTRSYKFNTFHFRGEVQKLLGILNDAGVRFIYFSPRNMRRQKELAQQMGIDVAWNCAISLRPLESGEEDRHRMVSDYADWDVNAKLPHGVKDVRKHLEEVDNVPLLVSLFTDVTKQTTEEMVNIFQDYHDTVIVVGLSHLPRNDGIFSTADIAVGIDILTENDAPPGDKLIFASVQPLELEFISAICAHSCAFRFRGASSVYYLSDIIEQSRGALDATTASGVFLVHGCLSFSLFVLVSACSPSTTIAYVPLLGSVLFLQIAIPAIGFAMAMSDASPNVMKEVPPKNDQSVTFRRKEGWMLYYMMILKALPPALFPLVMYLIAFGELLLFFEPEMVLSDCSAADTWVSVIRCDTLRDYSGTARTSAGVLSLAQLVYCVSLGSTSFVYRFSPLIEFQPWQGNQLWLVYVFIVIGLTSKFVLCCCFT